MSVIYKGSCFLYVLNYICCDTSYRTVHHRLVMVGGIRYSDIYRIQRVSVGVHINLQIEKSSYPK